MVIQVKFLNVGDMYHIARGKINVLLIGRINLCIWIRSISIHCLHFRKFVCGTLSRNQKFI